MGSDSNSQTWPRRLIVQAFVLLAPSRCGLLRMLPLIRRAAGLADWLSYRLDILLANLEDAS